MAANPDVLRRLNGLETRVRALELRAGDRQLARLTDNPPTIEHAAAIREALEALKVLGPRFANDPEQPVEVREAASAGWNTLQVMGLLPW